MYSFHSSVEEKNQLLHTLTTYGIETTVDRSKKKDRIREWIQASAIVEENEGDESDVYEDSEFYEDEDAENESEDAEPVPMRGRHFPERRPSAAASSDVRKNKRRVSSSRAASRGRTSASVKPMERKIPFAPQVAEERETVAHFASFPNGDPSLAAVGNGEDRGSLSATNITSDTSPSMTNMGTSSSLQSSSLANGRNVKDPARVNVDGARDESPASASPGVVLPTKPSPPRILSGAAEAKSSPGSSRIAPISPQIPTRKNRAHTAPFPDARAPENRGAESARRAQSATVLRAPEVEDPSQASAKVVASSRPMRADNPGIMTPSTPRVAARAPATPTMNDALPAARVEGSPTSSHPTTQLTPLGNVSATSHLVMQSFSALQSLTANVSNDASPLPVSRPDQRAEKAPLTKAPPTYGKDAYEHYGIAQGAILPMRVKVVRQDSAGSGSRSASN